jgi:hypothetical protein
MTGDGAMTACAPPIDLHDQGADDPAVGHGMNRSGRSRH